MQQNQSGKYKYVLIF
jgi:phosphatidylinositol kinase/protein kinase (PI-3  family)